MRWFPKKELSQPLWALAYPVVLGMMSRTFLTLVDTAMVGRLGADALAAAGLGGIAVWMINAPLFDVSIGTQAVVARRIGEKNPGGAGGAFNATLFLTLCIAPVLAVSGAMLGPALVPLLTDDPAVVGNCTAYFSIRMLEALPIMLLGCGRGFFDGIGHTQIYMRVMIFANLCNILLNWLLIFGHWGFPRMEVAGAAVASAISMYLGTALMAVIASARRYRSGYGILRFGGWTWSTLHSVVRLSAPASCRIFLILAGFTLFLTLIGKVGTAELAASHLVINISSLSWMPGFGMGIAVTTIVGQKLGASDPHGAREFSWEGVRLSWCMMAALGAVFLIMPEPVIRIFTNDPTVIAYAKPALRMLGLSQFIDPFNIVLEGALMGAGKMVYIMFLEVGIVWLVMLPATWYLLMVQGTGYLGAWAAFLLYIILLAAAIVRKFLQKEWETTKV